MRQILTTVFVLTTLSSCYTYKIYPQEFRRFEYAGVKKTAFILNPELGKEYAILKESGIFTFTTDSMGQNNLKIKLYALQKGFTCGQAGILSLITLGQFPVLFADRYTYRFEEISRSESIRRDFELHIAQRVWFWDIFAFNKRFNQKAGKALLGSYYHK